MKHNVLITGTSSGIGQATARLFAQQGYTVFAGVRKLVDAEPLAHPNIHPILLDVADAASIDAAVDTLTQLIGHQGLHAVINNAGIIYNGPFELASEAEVRRVMEVNFFGLVRLSQKTIGLLQTSFSNTRERAKLVFTSSIGAALGIPWEFSYHASKFAVNGLAEAISYELGPLGIDVTSVMPGGIQTPIFSKGVASAHGFFNGDMGRNHAYYKANIDAFAKTADRMYGLASKPEKAAQAMLRVVQAHKAPARIRVGTDAKILYLLVRLLPLSWRQALLRGQFVPHPQNTLGKA